MGFRFKNHIVGKPKKRLVNLYPRRFNNNKTSMLLQLCGDSKSAHLRKIECGYEYSFNTLLLPEEHVPIIISSIYATGIVYLECKYHYIPWFS